MVERSTIDDESDKAGLGSAAGRPMLRTPARTPVLLPACSLLFLLLALLQRARASSSTCAGLPLWPFPQECTAHNTSLITVNPSSFAVVVVRGVVSGATPDLDALLARFAPFDAPAEYRARGPTEPHMGAAPPSDWAAGPVAVLERLEVRVASAGPHAKALDTDESFSLSVRAPAATLEAQTWCGAQYGLEAFRQLLQRGDGGRWEVRGAPSEIRDAPRFAWRGLLVDTANHFLPPSLLRRVVDGMAMNRLNVLHWHLVGSYSFPLRVPALPWLSDAGAWHADAVYAPDEVSALVEYARARGVRVVPEVDVPGHAYAWGLGRPALTVACPAVIPGVDIGPVNVVPLDPTREEVYDAVRGVLAHVGEAFPDDFVHLGGDEVQEVCWSTDAAIERWMAAHNVSDTSALHAYFERRLLQMVAGKKKSVVWEETFSKVGHVLDANDTLVEVWDNATVVEEVARAGFRVILADGWYLDRQNPVDGETSWFWEDSWAQMYDVNPSSDAVIGGEANMWGEQVSALNWEARVWPRACAIAERLWSPRTVRGHASAAFRLAHHRCRMASRGVPTGPVWAGFCGADMVDWFAPRAPCPASETGVHLTVQQLVVVVAGSALATLVLLMVGVMCVRGCSHRPPRDDEQRANLLPVSGGGGGGGSYE